MMERNGHGGPRKVTSLGPRDPRRSGNWMTPGSHRRICCNHNGDGSHARSLRGETRPATWWHRDHGRVWSNRGSDHESLKPMMTATDVCGLYARLRALGVDVWIDGGWGVDALLENQTRPHNDLDIVIQQKDVPKLRALLEAEGYGDVPRDDTSPWNFVLGDDTGPRGRCPRRCF